uniref:Uncharacterized protein n=1 Tax=Hucho hucho TaxID=62062 RepID=A0A4W5QFV4_9TELE
MLEQKKISTKINYDILKELNVKPSTSPARQIAESPKGATPGAQRLTGQYRKSTNVPLSLGTPLSTLGKRLQPFISAQPHKKLALDQIANPLPVVSEAAPHSVLVESGPVVYDDMGDEEEEDEEESCVSAMQLLGGNEYGCDDDDGF